MTKVHFATTEVKELSAKATLPAKFTRMIDKLDFTRRFNKKTVAVKMHLGGGLSYTTIHPLFIRILVDKIREAGGRPFITDGSAAVWDTLRRGYSEETLGAKIIPAAGATERYFKTVPVNDASISELHLCGNIIDADAMIVLSHFKAHGEAGYGGAIKNIGMGCVTRASRGTLHRLETGGYTWDKLRCVQCGHCIENCPTGACKKNDKGEIAVNLHNCVYCRHCQKSCPKGAIAIDATSYRRLQEGLSIATREVLKHFDKDTVLYFNLALNITPLCDCWGFTTPSLVPDVGIFGSAAITAVDKASLDHVDARKLIPGSLPAGRKLMRKTGHLFQRIWGANPYDQIKAAERYGLGKPDYKIEYVE